MQFFLSYYISRTSSAIIHNQDTFPVVLLSHLPYFLRFLSCTAKLPYSQLVMQQKCLQGKCLQQRCVQLRCLWQKYLALPVRVLQRDKTSRWWMLVSLKKAGQPNSLETLAQEHLPLFRGPSSASSKKPSFCS